MVRRTGASGVLTMMEHSGTHIDALCHQACGFKLFGDLPVDGVETPAGFKKLGVEMVPPLLGRGVMLDVVRLKKVDRLPSMYSITDADLEACAAAQQTTVRPGDVLLVRTGFGAIWNEEEAYLAAAGVAKSGSQWALRQGVSAIGADNMTWDVPGERDPETGASMFAHVHLLAQKGIYIIENLNLETLARDSHYEFAFLGVPLKFQAPPVRRFVRSPWWIKARRTIKAKAALPFWRPPGKIKSANHSAIPIPTEKPMKALTALATVLFCIGVGTAQDADAIKKDKALMKGTWKIESLESEQGKNEDLKNASLTFEADKMIFKHDDKDDNFTYTLNPAGQPKEITFKLEDKEFQGIYKVEKEVITICISLNNTWHARPSLPPRNPT